MNKQKPTTVITAEQAAIAYWKAGELEDQYIERYREDAITKIKETKKCGFLWRKTRRITEKEREQKIEDVMEDIDFIMQVVSHKASSYYEISRDMKVLPGNQEVTVPVSIAYLAFATKED